MFCKNILTIVTVYVIHSIVYTSSCNVPEDWIATGVLGNRTISSSSSRGTKWPNAVVKYDLHPSLSPTDRVHVQTAFDDIQRKTCVRFEKRTSRDNDYVNIEVDDTVCGQAQVCRRGGPQFVKVGRGCRHTNAILHHLGHTLCLGHEHTRFDRDNYLAYPACNDHEIPPKTNYETMGHFYDHASQMHPPCGQCESGWPNHHGVLFCGPYVTEGLSYLDADKLNDLYDCKGCFSHRWRRIESLTDEDIGNLFPFGESHDGYMLYMCRASIGGEIIVGKYRRDGNVNWRGCYVTYGGREHRFQTNAQVFTLPGGDSGIYSLTPIENLGTTGQLVTTGRRSSNWEGYAAVAEIIENGRRQILIGNMYRENPVVAYFPNLGREVLSRNFSVLTCS